MKYPNYPGPEQLEGHRSRVGFKFPRDPHQTSGAMASATPGLPPGCTALLLLTHEWYMIRSVSPGWKQRQRKALGLGSLCGIPPPPTGGMSFQSVLTDPWTGSQSSQAPCPEGSSQARHKTSETGHTLWGPDPPPPSLGKRGCSQPASATLLLPPCLCRSLSVTVGRGQRSRSGI